MEKKKRLLKFLKSRKFILLVLPLLVFSIVSLIFFVVGGEQEK
jgi:ABC-type Na+ efflux pump permease subunit